uniref:non-specific serine/threonine protein kinase n=1 Tax=Astyanax mexicanus TaxID=7994 RepID=A0A8B9H5T8_ASTMX
MITDSTARRKVLKEIPVGDLKPDETVKANQEAQLLSQLHHPAILKFYSSFLERDAFCIVTEHCEDGDLDRKLEELRAEGNTLSEMQVIHWLVQLLLGVSYMHHRRILHRDLKAKNVFLKGNNMKIGDFGVSCLLMGSSDLATTFTGTPYYMSPEAISHRGYNSKSDIWSLGCILYEMCCLKHAFEGYNFLSVVMKIVEGSTPSLPESYSPELNSLMHRMLERDPRRRVSAEEALSCGVLEDLQKVHLQTLRERSEVEKMSPRERMRLRKLQAADERAKKLNIGLYFPKGQTSPFTPQGYVSFSQAIELLCHDSDIASGCSDLLSRTRLFVVFSSLAPPNHFHSFLNIPKANKHL